MRDNILRNNANRNKNTGEIKYEIGVSAGTG